MSHPADLPGADSSRRFSLYLLVLIAWVSLYTAGTWSLTAASRTAQWAEQEALYDSTVWQPEVQAYEKERILVRLLDSLRGATNKIAVLAEFPFQDIDLARVVAAPEMLELNIRRLVFEDETRGQMSHTQWHDILGQLRDSGWRLEQAAWHHENFMPATTDQPAQSEFSFELHGQRLAARTRFIATGRLGLVWSDQGADHLVVSNLVVLERAGRTGFELIGRVTPSAPTQRGELVDLHPITVADVDLDHDEDIILGGIDQVMVNQGDATFESTSLIPESAFHGASVSSVLGDFNGDGFVDFLTVGSKGSWTNRLVLYPGRGSLPLSGEPVVAHPYLRINSVAVLSAGDVDGDRDLDLWVAQYKQPYEGGQMPTPYYDANDGYPWYLLLNDGQGRFTTATLQSGLGAKAHRRVIAGSLANLDQDGAMDLLSVNDFCGVDLFTNDGTGKFTDETDRLYDPKLFGMTHCLGDFDRDGRIDFFVTGMSLPAVRRLEAMGIGREDMPDRTHMRAAMSYGNRMYLQRDGRWVQPSWGDDIARTGWTWGTSAADFDNDGDLDIYVANGQISGASSEDYDSIYWRHDIYLGSSRDDPELFLYLAKRLVPVTNLQISWNGHQHNTMLWDMGANRYLNVAYLLGAAYETDCRAVITADLDNDGRVDLLVSENDHLGSTDMGRNRLLIHRNTLETTNHWIGARLSWGKGGVSPFGASITARAGDRVYTTQIVTGTGYHSQAPNTAHFGLGQADVVDTLTVRWPDGTTQTLEKPAADRYHTFEPGSRESG